MLKNISNIGQPLSKSQLSKIKAGDGYTITCTFSDGTSWQGHTHDIDVANGMSSHCGRNGGRVQSFTQIGDCNNH